MTESTKKTVKKSKKKKMTPVSLLFCLVMLGIASVMLVQVVRQVITTISLQQQLSEAQEKYQETQDENQYLINEKEKLQDPDYVENYARGNYQLTKDGEQIFYLPATDNVDD